jgi:hypothetical protein
MLQISRLGLGSGRVGRIDQHSDDGRIGHQFMQQPKPLSHQLGGQNRNTRDVAAGPIQARYEAELDRVNASREGDWNCRGRGLGSKCWRDAGSGNHGYLTTNQIGCQGRQSVILALRRTVFDRDVLALDVADLSQTLPEGGETEIVGLRGPGAEIANHRHRLLRTGGKR